MSDAEIIGLSAAQAAREIAAGSLAPGDLFEAYRARAAEHASGAGLNCFTWVAPGAPAESPSGDGAEGVGGGALHGVPLAVKDLFCTEGVPSQSGSKILEGYLPPYTATAVSRLTAAGAST